MSILMTNMILSLYLTMMTLKIPVMMTINILIVALVTSWLYAYLLSSWYSFLIYLIYIGGMLIMFAYFVVLSPNQYLKLKQYITTLILTFILITIPSMFYSSLLLIPNFSLYLPKELYSQFNIPVLFLMILLLLYIMLAVAKMINISKGPLRPFL
uniref:NADH dehydrogenase subunit 6 n=1 Tax=Placobdella lamothei TaxID=1514856 RepID=A0A175D767_9ANNE|nr:NADH dehydrogenase subunit 6 [Placobdella lamothei]CVK87349.1 NADH dehydrogenase subunit 6 [Placobdella lamothei]